jgi:hypothetical protein
VCVFIVGLPFISEFHLGRQVTLLFAMAAINYFLPLLLFYHGVLVFNVTIALNALVLQLLALLHLSKKKDLIICLE